LDSEVVAEVHAGHVFHQTAEDVAVHMDQVLMVT